MSEDDDFGRRLGESLDAHARAYVPDRTPVPAPRFADAAVARAATGPDGRRSWLPPLAAAAVVVAVVALAFGLNRGSGGDERPAASPSSAGTASHAPAVITKPVRIAFTTAQGASYGVGMPVIALLSHKITDGRAFQRDTTVTVDGAKVAAAWYFESSDRQQGYPLEAHLRMSRFWPAHASIRVSMPVRGASAGGGWHFAADQQVSFRTGAAMVSVVDSRTHQMTVDRDGRRIATYKVSLGARRTPTESGIKVVMAKGLNVCMSGPGYNACGVKYTQRLTYGGEYLHAAPWNMYNIEHGVNTSNGCTNMLPADAQALYDMSEVGDVVEYPDADGPKMSAGAGYGDWNVPWSTWLRGGAVPTR